MHRPSFPAPISAQVQAAWQTQMTAARENPGLLPTLARHRRNLLPRFAGYYQHLNALPRRARRALQRQWRHSLAGVAFLLALGIAGPAQGATILVDGTTCTLVDAITAANTDAITGGCTAGSGADTIALPPGSTQTLTAVNNIAYGPNGLPVVKTAITIEGNGSTITRGSGAPGFRFFFVEPPGNLTLRETTVSGGSALPGPNEPYTWASGGAVFNYYAAVTLITSTISGNVARNKGGGVYNYYGTLTVANSTISGNTAGFRGGGVFNYGAVAVTKSTISGNIAGYLGGGIDSYGIVTVHNSTISGNTAACDGGGVNNQGFLTLTDSTISGNTANCNGGGVSSSSSGLGPPGRLTLARTLVSGNSAPHGPEIRSNFGPGRTSRVLADNFNLFGHDGASGILGFSPGSTTDLVPAKPIGAILNPILANNGGSTLTHALVPGSPAVDAVTGGGCPPRDQRRFVRPVDGDGHGGARCDIGAVEFGAKATLNHFLCYNVGSSRGSTCTHGSINKGSACETEAQCGGTTDLTGFCQPNGFPQGLRVTLSDQRETNVFDVPRSVSLCTPADKNHEDPTALSDPDHLEAYQISVASGHAAHARLTNLTVTNQFGSLQVDTVRPSRLLVPTAKGENATVPEPAMTIDHFECHTVKRSRGTPAFPKGVQATVADQFTPPKLFDVIKPTRLCMPVNKNGESPGAENHRAHLMCYHVERAAGEPTLVKVDNIRVANQLDDARVNTISEEELCVPSTRTP
jgi:hypothetical protein